MALLTRLRSTRSIRRSSTSATHGVGASTTEPYAALAGQRRGLLRDAVGDVGEVDLGELEPGGTGVEPADLEQVGEEVLESVELLLQQLGRACRDRLERCARVVQHVAGHPHGGQGRAQLVGHVGDELALDPRQLDQLPDLLLERVGHLVERGGQPGDVVLAVHVHPLLEAARGDPLRHPPREPDRGDHLAGDQQHDAGGEQQEEGTGGEQRPLHQAERPLLVVHREEVVERVGAAVRGQHDPRADDHRRRARCPAPSVPRAG